MSQENYENWDEAELTQLLVERGVGNTQTFFGWSKIALINQIKASDANEFIGNDEEKSDDSDKSDDSFVVEQDENDDDDEWVGDDTDESEEDPDSMRNEPDAKRKKTE